MFTILGADGKEYGPVPAAKVQEWISGGRANFQTKARRVDEADWKTLGDFPEFVAAPPPPAGPTLAPGGTADALARPAGRPLAGRWERLGAQLLDGIIAAVVAAPGMILLAISGAFSNPDNANTGLMIGGAAAVCVLLLGLVVFQVYLLSTTGQTLGKKALGVRVVNLEDEGNPGFVKAFLLRGVVNSVIGAIPFLGGIYSLVDICFIFREDKRCIHDLIAGTKVVVA